MRFAAALLSLAGLFSLTPASAQTYYGGWSYCGSSNYCGTYSYCSPQPYRVYSYSCSTPQVVYQNCCPQPCQSSYQSPWSSCSPKTAGYSVQTYDQATVCVVCPVFRYASYPNYASYYSQYCFNAMGEPAYYDSWDDSHSGSNICHDGYCTDFCESGSSCACSGTCQHIAAARKLGIGPKSQPLDDNVYNDETGFRLTVPPNGKKLEDKIISFSHKSQERLAHVFAILLVDKEGKNPTVIRFGHEIKSGETDKKGRIKSRRDRYEAEVYDEKGEVYRIHTHYWVKE